MVERAALWPTEERLENDGRPDDIGRLLLPARAVLGERLDPAMGRDGSFPATPDERDGIADALPGRLGRAVALLREAPVPRLGTAEARERVPLFERGAPPDTGRRSADWDSVEGRRLVARSTGLFGRLIHTLLS